MHICNMRVWRYVYMHIHIYVYMYVYKNCMVEEKGRGLNGNRTIVQHKH